MTFDDDNRKAIITRLKRVEGQVRGIQAMIDSGSDCEKVAQQLAAARKALDKAFYEMMACAMRAQMNAAPDLASAQAVAGQMTRMLARFG